MNTLPRFSNYGQYSSDNYGAHTLVFTDANGNDFYYSYQTLVAARVRGHGLIVHTNDWGPTTGKHLNWIDGGNRDARVSREAFTATLQAWLSDEDDDTELSA